MNAYSRKKLRKTIAIVCIYISIIGILLAVQSVIMPSFDNQQKSAKVDMEAGKLATAIEKYRKLVRVHPNNVEAHLKLGELYEQVNDIENAKIEYYRAMKVSPRGKFKAHFALANLYLRNNQTDMALDIINQIRDINNSEFWEAKGKFYTNLAEKNINI